MPFRRWIWARRHRGHRMVIFTALSLVSMLAMSALAPLGAAAAPLVDCAGPVAGRHIYDCTGLLTPAEIASLEGRAAGGGGGGGGDSRRGASIVHACRTRATECVAR